VAHIAKLSRNTKAELLSRVQTKAWVGCNALIDKESATYVPFSDGETTAMPK
jgi:hypothetical protein